MSKAGASTRQTSYAPGMRLSAKVLTIPLAAALFSGTASSQTPLDHRELAADQQVIHSLNRLTFGPKPGDVQKVRAIGLDKWIELQLHPEKIEDRSFEKFLDHYNVLKENQDDLLRDYVGAQRARREVKREAGDSTMNRREILADNPELQQAAL